MKQFLICLGIVLFINGCSYKEQTTVITVAQKDGLIDSDANIIVKPIYKKVYYMDNIAVNEYAHPHYINLHWIHIDDEKFAIVKNIDNKMGIIGEDGTLKLKVIFDSIGTFFNGFAKIEVNHKFGLINEDFEIVLKPIYDDIRNVLDGTIIVKNYETNKQAKYGCLNEEMELIASLDYDMIYLSSEERMRVEKSGLWGFLDLNCNVIAKAQYTFADDYSNGVARVKKGEVWTFLDLEGEELSHKIFNDADNFIQ